MDRYWLLTLTTYGTWLPGDKRGFVGPIMEGEDQRVIHNIPGTAYDAAMPNLRTHAETLLRGEPIRLTTPQADLLLAQFHETARCRGWRIFAVAIMSNHIHIVVGVAGDPDPATLLRDFKSYGSRVLNARWQKPDSETWWTESGSRRKLKDEQAVLGAVRYVQEQYAPLVVWVLEELVGRS